MKDIYLYEDCDVLKNKLNIKDPKKLDAAEGSIVSFAIAGIMSNPIKIDSVFAIKTIHEVLFGDIYDWAGQNRKINIYKEEPVLNGLSVSYSNYKNIDKDLKELDKYFKGIKWKALSKGEIIDHIVVLISRLWRIHCFREGNTRSATTFLYLLMKELGMKVDANFIGKHAKYFRNALVLASIDEYSEYEYLRNILSDSVSYKDIESGKYKTIGDYEVENYEYTSHKYKD